MGQQGRLKVTVSLTKGLHPMWVSSTGLKFNDAFIDRLYEVEEQFRERIILPLNDIVGDDWSVHFGECPDVEPTFLVDIIAPDQHLNQIVWIISNAFPEINIQFWKRAPYVCLGTRKAISCK